MLIRRALRLPSRCQQIDGLFHIEMRQLIAAARIHYVSAHPYLCRLRIAITNGAEDNLVRFTNRSAAWLRRRTIRHHGRCTGCRKAKLGHDAFAVIWETIRNMDMVAVGRVVSTNRERIIALGLWRMA